MQFIRRAQVVSGGELGGRENFDGVVRAQGVHQTEEAVGLAIVHFERGARTHWHAHRGGQVVHVIEGSGRIQAWGESLEYIESGDFAIAPPGEKHWHGASAHADMVQLSVASGSIDWMEEVRD